MRFFLSWRWAVKLFLICFWFLVLWIFYFPVKCWFSSLISLSPLTLEVVGAPQMTLQQYLSTLPCLLYNLDQILCVASLGVGIGCIMFWSWLDQNSGAHGNRKPPLIYNGKNGVSTFSRLLLIQSFLYLQVTRTCMTSRTSSNCGQIGPLTMELAALERLKNFL